MVALAGAPAYETPILSKLGPVPKDPLANIRYRKRLHYLCEVDPEFRREVWIRCSRDFVFWCDGFVWTLATKLNRKFPRMPFVLFDVQERAARSIIRAIGLEDRLVEKSRDMGATWLIIAIFVWLFLFRADQSFLIGSRKQELVDKQGDPKSLFHKILFIIEHLPEWMRPFPESKMGDYRKQNHIENPKNGSVIDGESTNENFGAGDRRTAVLLDEFALVDIGYRILAAIGDVSDCVIYNSTPLTASGAYYDVLQKLLLKHPDWVLRLHWTDHPYKRRGLYRSDSKGNLELLDDPAVYPKGYDFVLDGKTRSFAYDARDRRSPNPQIMAQQWDIDYLKSGWQFFDAVKLEELLKNQLIVRPPLVRGEITLNPDWRSPKFVGQHRSGRLMLWTPLPLSGKWAFDDIGIACDIASGSGGDHSSNSSASIVRRSTGEKIGEWTDNLTPPNEFARTVLAIATWFNDAMISWERNGPNGAQFGKVIKDSGYTNLYRQKKEARFDYVENKEPGWWTSPENKASLLGTYAEALWAGLFSNHSEEALKECGHYVQNGNSIEHSRALANNSVDPTAAGDSHGDRCFVAGTVIRTIVGDRPIESIKIGDMVLTRNGYRMVIACGKTSESAAVVEAKLSNGVSLTGTGNHPIWTKNDGWVALSSLTQKHTLLTCQEFTRSTQVQRQLSSMALHSIAGHIRSTNIFGGIIGRTLRTKTKGLVHSIAKSGSRILEIYRTAFTSTTRTAIHSTTTSAIWSASALLSTPRYTASEIILMAAGTPSSTSISVSTAERNTKPFESYERNTARKRARNRIEDRARFITKCASALSAVISFWSISTEKAKRALRNAEAVCGLEIAYLPERQPVYNLSVAECPEYFANGVLVHNCIADSLAYRMVEEYTKATRQVAEKREVIPVNCAAYRRQQRQEMAAEVGEYHWI